MKKHVLLGAALFLGTGLVWSQQTPVPNGDLEAWTVVNGNDEPSGGMLKSLNEITAWPGSPPVTCYKETAAPHGGTAAARVVSKDFPAFGIFIPGVLGTVKAIINPPSAVLAVPFTAKPEGLKAWIKYTSVQGDSAEIFSYLFKTTGGVRETLATASKKITQSVPNWELQELSYNYLNAGATPDSISLVFVASAGYDFTNLLQCQGKENSTMYIDDVSLTYPMGVEEVFFNGETINVYPNPAENVVNVTVTQTLGNAVLSVTDINGREVLAQTVSGNAFTVDVTTLKAGNYVVSLKQDKTILGRKTFVKK